MASTARVLRVVKPHVPMIKFPNRGGPSAAVPSSQLPSAKSAAPPSSASSSKAVGKVPRGTGVDFTDLPLRYWRKVIPSDEMEYIEKGGQV